MLDSIAFDGRDVVRVVGFAHSIISSHRAGKNSGGGMTLIVNAC
jgi:hypothetical protein